MRLSTAAVLACLVTAACVGDTSDVEQTSGASSSTMAAVASVPTVVEEQTTTTVADAPEATLWVTDSVNGIVNSINPFEVTVVGEDVVVGAGAESIAFGAGSVWVVGNLDGVVHRIDPVGPNLLETIDVGPGAAGVTFSDGFVFVASFGSDPDFMGSVAVIDPELDTVVETLDIGSGLTGMASDSVFGVAYESGEVYRIDSSEGQFEAVTAPVASGLSEIAVAEDYLFVTGISDGALYRLDKETLEVLDRLALGIAPNFIAYDGSGKVWVTDSFGVLWSVDIETLDAVEETYIPSPTGIDAVVFRDRPWLFVAAWEEGVYRIDPTDPDGSMRHVFLPAEGAGLFDVAFGNGGQLP